jgi:hypothetical protein
MLIQRALADPFQHTRLPEVIEEYLDWGITKCVAFNRRGTLLAGIFALTSIPLILCPHQTSRTPQQPTAAAAAAAAAAVQQTLVIRSLQTRPAVGRCLSLHPHVLRTQSTAAAVGTSFGHRRHLMPPPSSCPLPPSPASPPRLLAAGTDDGHVVLWDFDTRGPAKVLNTRR